MSLTKSLRLVQAERPRHYDPIATRRRKMIEKLDEQMSGLMQEGEGMKPSRRTSRRVRDSETGMLVLRELDQVVKPWWWRDAQGKFFMQLRYGTRPIELVKGKPAIQAESREAMEQVLREIIAAVQAGELDAHLKETAETIRARFKR